MSLKRHLSLSLLIVLAMTGCDQLARYGSPPSSETSAAIVEATGRIAADKAAEVGASDADRKSLEARIDALNVSLKTIRDAAAVDGLNNVVTGVRSVTDQLPFGEVIGGGVSALLIGILAWKNQQKTQAVMAIHNGDNPAVKEGGAVVLTNDPVAKATILKITG